MPRIFCLFLLSSSCSALHPKPPIQAFCTVPVADLLSERFSPTASLTAADFYAALPLSERQPITLCCRTTQLLFNERVTIIEEQNDQSFVETPFWHLKTPSLKSPSTKNNRFWTLTKNLCRISSLSSEAQATIPSTNLQEPNEKVVTLSLPWFCKETKTTYSAGTRFTVRVSDNTGYHVIFAVLSKPTPIEGTIPLDHAIPCKKRSEKEQRALFVKTVRQWAAGIPNTIPYVWGGASIIETFVNPVFKEQRLALGNKKGHIFTRPECTAIHRTGVDCAGIIRLACKVAGIPLTATNSRSITKTVRILTSSEPIQDGDLIAWKGHIAIIADVKKGLMIEARGYESLYGCVQEIPYAEQLKGIRTTADLKAAFLKKKPITRVNKKGNEQKEVVTDLKILSLFGPA